MVFSFLLQFKCFIVLKKNKTESSGTSAVEAVSGGFTGGVGGGVRTPGTEQHPLRVLAPPETPRTPLENGTTTNIFS